MDGQSRSRLWRFEFGLATGCVSGTEPPARQVPAQCSVILLWADPYYLAISQRRDLSPPAPKKENPNFFDIRIRFHQAQPARQVTMS
jgi:hypothetical protein